MKWSSIPLTPPNLTLANTLPVGQSFLWHHSNGTYSRAINNPPRVIFLRQTPTELEYSSVLPNSPADDHEAGIDRRWIEDYFQLQYDLPALYSQWRERDPGLFAKTELDSRAIGVRVLRQDPFECLIAFITSTNNHIGRITSLMHKFSKKYSPPMMTIDEITYHLFPEPHTLPEDLEPSLRDLGFGYRAGFIESTMRDLREKFGVSAGDIDRGLEGYRRAPLVSVRDDLITLKGVGRKVADCVMLMCMDRHQLVPIDTHLMAIAARHPDFPARLKGKPMSKQIYDEVQEFLEERWGEMGGWTQAVMFAADLKPKAEVGEGKGKEGKERKRKVKEEWIEVEVKEEVRIEDIETRPGIKRTRSAIVAAQIAKLEIKEEAKEEGEAKEGDTNEERIKTENTM